MSILRWLLVLVLLFVGVLILAWRGRLGLFRREIRAYLEENVDGLKVTEETRSRFTIRIGEHEGTLFLQNVMREVTMLKPDAVEERAEVYERLAMALRESSVEDNLCIDSVRNQILPQLKPQVFFDQQTGTDKLVRAPLGETGLFVAYVIDREACVQYISEVDLKELGLSAAELHDLALANMSDKLPKDLVQRAVNGKELRVFKAMDTFDAARILVIPGYLSEGEELAALIPDRDTLMLIGVPQDGDWSALTELACVPASDHLLLAQPLLVTHVGFQVK